MSTRRTRRLAAARAGAEDKLAALRARQLEIAARLAENEPAPDPEPATPQEEEGNR